MRSDLQRRIEAALAAIYADHAGPLTLDARGMISLGFTGGVTLTLEAPDEAHELAVHTPLMPVSAADAPTLLRALGMNRFGLTPATAWIAHDADAGELMLCGIVPAADVAAEPLDAFLDAFIAAADAVARQLKGPDTTRPATPGGADPAGGTDGGRPVFGSTFRV